MVLPERPVRSLAAKVPHGKLDVLVDNLLEVAHYGGVRVSVFSRLQAVQPGGLWCAESQAQGRYEEKWSAARGHHSGTPCPRRPAPEP